MKLIDNINFEIKQSKSIIGFSTEGGGSWKVWDRYLTIDGQKAYHIGNICGTCSFFFERLGGANKNIFPKGLSSVLRKGLDSLDKSFIDSISAIIPNGRYLLALTEINPRLITLGSQDDYFSYEQVKTWGMDGFWGLPHHPKVRYYRGLSKKMDSHNNLYEFIIPMFPQNWLDDETVNSYKNVIKSKARPTAVSISVLDVKEPAIVESNAEELLTHYCLAHYLIDGHHKVFAASILREPITLLSFIAIDEGISELDDIKHIMKNINKE